MSPPTPRPDAKTPSLRVTFPVADRPDRAGIGPGHSPHPAGRDRDHRVRVRTEHRRRPCQHLGHFRRGAGAAQHHQPVGRAARGAGRGHNGRRQRTGITIRGLSGQYTLILVDGKRQGTRESRTNGSAGIEQNWIPPSPPSTGSRSFAGRCRRCYGSDAMGGVVNVITKPVADRWTGSVTAEATCPRQRRRVLAPAVLLCSGPVRCGPVGPEFGERRLDRSESRVVDGLRDREIDGPVRRGSLETPDPESHTSTWRAGAPQSGSGPRRPHHRARRFPRQRRRTTACMTTPATAPPCPMPGQWGHVAADLSVLREVGQRKTASGNGAPGRRRPRARGHEHRL